MAKSYNKECHGQHHKHNDHKCHGEDKEIGILKAIGSKSSEILLIFISEATITGIVGGVLGSALGFVLGSLVGNWIGLPVSVTYDLGMAVIMFAVLTSVVAGLYPSWQASRLHPVEALRYE